MCLLFKMLVNLFCFNSRFYFPVLRIAVMFAMLGIHFIHLVIIVLRDKIV